MNYSAKLGRKLLQSRHKILDVVTTKWQGVLLASYKFRWDSMWDRKRVWKEARLIWMTWHKAVATNKWR